MRRLLLASVVAPLFALAAAPCVLAVDVTSPAIEVDRARSQSVELTGAIIVCSIGGEDVVVVAAPSLTVFSGDRDESTFDPLAVDVIGFANLNEDIANQLDAIANNPGTFDFGDPQCEPISRPPRS